MKKIIVSIKNKTVRIINGTKDETCNFYEAGLEPSGEVITDEDEIRGHLKEREGTENIEIV